MKGQGVSILWGSVDYHLKVKDIQSQSNQKLLPHSQHPKNQLNS